MNDDNRRLFERVAKKMGWTDQEGLDGAERKLISSIGKTRHGAISGHPHVDRSSSPTTIYLSGSEDEAEKENLCSMGNDYRNKSLIESSDDDFDQFLVGRATPRAKPLAQKTCSATKKEYSTVVVVSSDDEDDFESFLQRVKTPTTKPNKKSQSVSEDSFKNFIVDDYSSGDDFIETQFSLKVPKKSNTPASKPPLRRPLTQLESPVFFGDSDDDDDNILVKSTWKTRHSKPKPDTKTNSDTPLLCGKDESLPSPPVSSVSSPFSFPPPKTPTLPKCTFSTSSKLDESASSDDEFTSLLERLKRKNKLSGTSFSPKNTKECSKKPPVLVPPAERRTMPASKSLGETPLKTPGKSTMVKPTVSQTEPRHGPTSRVALCKIPGCFLQSLSNPGSSFGHSFKQNKGNLTAKLYQLYNTSVFDSKLPADMSVTWNKKMRKTAGYCITGQERGGGSRYARIELSEKVCDSADRLRDTLIHEMCHAATWLINGVRDGHGNFWKFYARKSTVVHPELPMVTRCHTYDIKYKFQYQCTRCQNSIGRHSKSLDTQRFVCALCTGHLVLLTPSKPRAPAPFANFVKENYGTVRQELAGQSHAEVMRKLSADFASKTKLSQS